MENLRQTNDPKQPLVVGAVDAVDASEGMDREEIILIAKAVAGAALIVGAAVAGVNYINGDDAPNKADAVERAEDANKRGRAFHSDLDWESDKK